MDSCKFSGSATPSYGFLVEGCTYLNCGRNHDGTITGGVCVQAGADDIQTHGLVAVINCHALDCSAFASIVGARNIRVVGNQIYHRTALPSVLATMILVSRYTSTSEPVEDVLVAGNQCDSEVKSGTTFVTQAIDVRDVGIGLSGRASTVRITDN